MKIYKSLFKKYKDQGEEEIFAAFRYNGAAGETWETPFEPLGEGRICQQESWNFVNERLRQQYAFQKYPILTNYLNYTFLRLQDQGRIAYSADGDKACFNTGLQTEEEKDIYATFFRNKAAAQFHAPDWTFFTFAESYSDKLAPFEPLPDIATYIDDPSDLVFDFHLGGIDVNYRHIIVQNRERLPEALQANEQLALLALRGSIQSMLERVRRNYKIAIPHWYDNKIQLLMPLQLVGKSADLALVVDKDKERGRYFARTVLTMDMAYIDARLLARPDREWLNP
nr:DUF3825 domain-containing protein [Maliibacterium massiliense]